MSVGLVSVDDAQSAAKANQEWLHDCLAILLTLLVLDRFADFGADQVTVPVREAAAQALALAAVALPLNQQVALLQTVVKLQDSDQWEVRLPSTFPGAISTSAMSSPQCTTQARGCKVLRPYAVVCRYATGQCWPSSTSCPRPKPMQTHSSPLHCRQS